MARVTGGTTKAGIRQGSTHNTAVECDPGHGFGFDSIDHSDNAQELSSSPNGLGLAMLQTSEQGLALPSGTIKAKPTFDNALMTAIACFMGTSGAGAEQTSMEGDYLHTMLHGSTLRFFTLAFLSTTTLAIEYKSCYPTRLNFSSNGLPQYLDLSIDWISGDREMSSAVNTAATLADVTQSDSEVVSVRANDTFWINAQGGDALDSGDAVSIIGFNATLDKPKVIKPEMSGSLALPAPVETGLFAATLQITMSGLDAHTYYTAAAAGTEYKAMLTFQGTQIGAGDNKALSLVFPRLKVIMDPTYNVSDPGQNPHVVQFKALAASAAPTGMADEYPHILVTNERSTAYIA